MRATEGSKRPLPWVFSRARVPTPSHGALAHGNCERRMVEKGEKKKVREYDELAATEASTTRPRLDDAKSHFPSSFSAHTPSAYDTPFLPRKRWHASTRVAPHRCSRTTSPRSDSLPTGSPVPDRVLPTPAPAPWPLALRLPAPTSRSPTRAFSAIWYMASLPTTRSLLMISGSFSKRALSNSCRAEARSTSRQGTPFGSGHVNNDVTR